MKKVFLILSSLVLTLGLTACGPTHVDPIEGEDLEFDLDTPVTISFLHSLGNELEIIIKEYIDEFMEKYPNITVEQASTGGGYDQLKEQIEKGFQANQYPNVALGYGDHVAAYRATNRVLTFDGFIKNRNIDPVTGGYIGFTDEEFNDFFPNFISEMTNFGDDNRIHGLPFAKSTEAMFYNEKELSALAGHDGSVPRTWDDAIAIARKWKALPGNAEKFPIMVDSQDNLFIVSSLQKGIPYTKYSADPAEAILFNNQEARDMVSLITGWHNEGLVTTRAASNNQYGSAFMVNNNTLFSIGSTAGARNFATSDEQAQSVNVQVAPSLQFDLNNELYMQQGPSIIGFNHGDEQKAVASWLFMKHMTSTEVGADYAIRTGYVAGRASSFETEAFINFSTNAQTLVPRSQEERREKIVAETILIMESVVDKLQATAPFEFSSAVRRAVGAIFTDAFEGNMSIDKSFEDAYGGILF